MSQHATPNQITEQIQGSSSPNQALNLQSPSWELPKRGDRVIQIRISRNISIALIFSILLHLLLLITLVPKLLNPGGQSSSKPTSLDVRLTLPPPSQASVTAPEPLPEIAPKPTKKAKPKSISIPSPTPPVIALNKPSTEKATTAITRQPPLKTTPPPVNKTDTENSPDPLPGEDMQAYVKRQKERRQAAQGYTQKDSDEINTRDSAPTSDDDKRMAAIQRNLQPQGGNGIFQLREISIRTARFSFKGWKNDYSKARQRDIDVEVPPGGDIQRAIVKKMIAIIREEYTGDFNWESQRLNRVISLSARPGDNTGLEDFLIEEFFGRGGIVPR